MSIVFTITPEQNRSIDVLMPLGYAITHFYADGILRMETVNGPDKSGLFIRPDGTVKVQNIPHFDANGNPVRDIRDTLGQPMPSAR